MIFLFHESYEEQFDDGLLRTRTNYLSQVRVPLHSGECSLALIYEMKIAHLAGEGQLSGYNEPGDTYLLSEIAGHNTTVKTQMSNDPTISTVIHNVLRMMAGHHKS